MSPTHLNDWWIQRKKGLKHSPSFPANTLEMAHGEALSASKIIKGKRWDRMDLKAFSTLKTHLLGVSCIISVTERALCMTTALLRSLGRASLQSEAELMTPRARHTIALAMGKMSFSP